MCLAIPMKVEKIMGDFAIVSIGKNKRKVNISFIGKLKKGDYVIVHAGFAIEKLSKTDADETLKIIEQLK
ncbi:MAG: HypC/HybG/HupF family hydrogenase formation chaperone [Candidatus Omnitrophica bacterium]|nr:HypC/HybG/HupF family hydrogenase formation chaperone [Candidatus Omnitrophota bacterium]